MEFSTLPVTEADRLLDTTLVEDSQSLMHEDDSCTWSFFNTICFPFTCWCSWNQLGPLQHGVVSKWGRPVEVWKSPGIYHLGPIGSKIDQVYVGLKSVEIKEQVNDSVGSPVVVSAQLAYKVTDAVKYLFKTQNLGRYLNDQARSAITSVAAKYPYDYDVNDIQSGQHTKVECLRITSKKIDGELTKNLMNLIGDVGIQIEFFRIQSVAYEAGMEKILLARQEAHSTVNAKNILSKGVAEIASETIKNLEKFNGIEITQEQKTSATINLLYLLTHQGSTSLNLFPSQPPTQGIVTGVIPPGIENTRGR